MKVFKKILNTIINILIILVLVVSVLVATLALTSKSSGISSIFGYSVQVIQSDSMKGGSEEYEGGDFQDGDIIIGKVTDNADALKPETYKEGDIVTYLDTLDGNEHLGVQLICHRIVDVINVKGDYFYQTQGDNRKISPAPDQMEEAEYIDARSIVAVYKTDDYEGFKIAGVGEVFDYINTQTGFFLCILLPMIIFFVYVLIKVVIDAVNYSNAKKEEKAKKEKEENDKNSDPKTSQMTDEEYEEFKAFMAMKNAEKSSDKDDNISDNSETDETSSEITTEENL